MNGAKMFLFCFFHLCLVHKGTQQQENNLNPPEREKRCRPRQIFRHVPAVEGADEDQERR